jgi:hypothetical protein
LALSVPLSRFTSRAGMARFSTSGGCAFMKTTLTVLLSGLLLCGCSQKPATSARPAIDLVEAGQATAWQAGCVLHVAKRDGTALEGIQIIKTAADGQKTTFTAATGTVSPGSTADAQDENFVTFSLHNVQVEKHDKTRKTLDTAKEMTIALHK